MGKKCTVFYFITKKGTNPIRDFLNSLPYKQQTKVLRIFQYIEEYGLNSALPHIKKLKKTVLWEIRILGKDNIRILYIVPEKLMVLVLHGFIKKTPKTPQREIKKATDRYNNWKKRKFYLDK